LGELKRARAPAFTSSMYGSWSAQSSGWVMSAGESFSSSGTVRPSIVANAGLHDTNRPDGSVSDTPAEVFSKMPRNSASWRRSESRAAFRSVMSRWIITQCASVPPGSGTGTRLRSTQNPVPSLR